MTSYTNNTTTNNSNSYDDYSIYIETIQAPVIGKLFEALNANVGSINLWFTPQNLTSVSSDPSQACECLLRLDNKNFETWYVENTFMVGINVPILFKLIKDSIKAKNTLTMYVCKNDQKFYVRVNNDNSCDCSGVPILTLNPPDIRIPSINYQTMISLPSHQFLQYCKTCGSTGTEMVRIIVNNELQQFTIESIGVSNPASKQITISGKSDTNLIFRSNTNNIFSGVFTLRFCHNIAKSCVMSEHVHIYMENGYPIVFQFDCGNLGSLKFFLYSKDEDLI